MTFNAADSGAATLPDPYDTKLRNNPGVAILELESFTPSTPQLAATQTAFIEFIQRNSEGFTDPRYMDGHFIAGAVVLHPTKPLVALFRRSRHSPWTFPNGHVGRFDSSLAQTAWREASIKLGLDGKLEQLEPAPLLLHAEQSPHRSNAPHLHAVVTYSFRAGRGGISTYEFGRAVDWVKPDEVAARMGAGALAAAPLIDYVKKTAG